MTSYSTIAALDITTAGVTDGNGRISDGVDNSGNKYQRIHWYARFETGTSPVGDTLIEIYAFREDNHGTEYVSDGETLTDGALSGTPQNAQFIGSMVVTSASDTMHYVEGVWESPGPGRWAMGFMNETGATLSTTEADGFIHWVGEKA